MPDVGDAVTLTMTTTTGASVTAAVTDNDGTTAAPVAVPETPPASGMYPFTFVPDAAGMWGVKFAASGAVTAVQQRWIRVRDVAAVPPLAAPEDVAASWRTLTATEEDVAARMIDDASLIVRQRFTTVDTRLADGSLSRDLVAMVVAGMVRRLMQAPPAGLQSWTVDDYTERYVQAAAGLTLLEDELDLLAPAGSTTGAFTIRPRGTDPSWPSWC